MQPMPSSSNPRDVGRGIVDYINNPFNIRTQCYEGKSKAYAQTEILVLRTRSGLPEWADDHNKSSLDLYGAVRSLYRQCRLNYISFGYSGDLSAIHRVSNIPDRECETKVEEISTKP